MILYLIMLLNKSAYNHNVIGIIHFMISFYTFIFKQKYLI